MLPGCIRFRTSLPPDYEGVDEFAEYVNSNADISPLSWSVDLDKDSEDENGEYVDRRFGGLSKEK